MAYKNQSQFMAVSKLVGSDSGVTVPELPMLEGKLAQIDPEFAQRWNLGVELFRANLAVEIDRAIAESKTSP